MSLRGDDDGAMRTPLTDDDVIEAILRGDAVSYGYGPLATFAERVRSLADEPVPKASPELAALLDGGASPGDRTAVTARPARVARRTGRRGRAAKLGVGTSLVLASVVGAGAAGVLPAAATDAVRGAIEVISPVHFPRPVDTHTTPATPDGRRVADDATGRSDGTGGVDGPTIADDAPGAANRPGPAVVDGTPGQTGDTGLTRANETPAAPHAPEVPPSTVPARGDHDHAPGDPPTTTPSPGGPAAG